MHIDLVKEGKKMPQPFVQPPQIKTRISILVFLKGTAAPLVLYFENPIAVYEELTQVLKTTPASNKLIEKDTIGPIKKVCLAANQICAVAMQEEQYA